MVRRAREILEELENGSAPVGADVPIGPSSHDEQISLGDLGGQTVLNKLRMTDVNILSPIEALNLLAELKQDLNGAEGLGRIVRGRRTRDSLSQRGETMTHRYLDRV